MDNTQVNANDLLQMIGVKQVAIEMKDAEIRHLRQKVQELEGLLASSNEESKEAGE